MKVVVVVQPPVLDVQRIAAEAPAMSHEHTLGPACRDGEVGDDLVAAVSDIDDHRARDGAARQVGVAIARRGEAWPVCVDRSHRMQRERIVFTGFGPPQLDQVLELFWIVLRNVIRL